MILSRRYVPLVVLYDRDERSKEIIAFAYSNSKMSTEEQEWHWNIMCSNRISVENADMGCCIPNFEYIKEEFERLDIEFPYDNGYNLSNVNKVHLIDWNEDVIQIQLSNCFDGEEQIVGFAVLNKDDILPTEADLVK